jgi:hypothetical protein
MLKAQWNLDMHDASFTMRMHVQNSRTTAGKPETFQRTLRSH